MNLQSKNIVKDYEHDNENETVYIQVKARHIKDIAEQSNRVTQGCSLNKARMVILTMHSGQFQELEWHY